MKIVLVYLDVLNSGDRIIYDTARWLTETILDELNIKAEIVPLDIGSYRVREARKKLNAAGRLYYKMTEKQLADLRQQAQSGACTEKQHFLRLWKRSFHYAYYRKYEADKLQGADVILFCGGGLIKYHQQDFHYCLHEITEYAEMHHIPVILNAVGIEGYAENNPECMILKEAVNRSCVTDITTRDDIETLDHCYIVNRRIHTAQVCDPAFWIPETYDIHADVHSASGKIGINLIRPDIFGEYSKAISREELGSLYHDMITLLRKDGQQVTLFSNGADADDRFGSWLLQQYPDLQGTEMNFPKDAGTYIRLLTGFDRIIASRLHTSIVSYVLGIPNVSLVWNRKQILFGEQVGLSENYIPMEDFRAEHIIQKLYDAKANTMNKAYKNTVRESLKDALYRNIGGSHAEH